jgi:hypothetical protein
VTFAACREDRGSRDHPRAEVVRHALIAATAESSAPKLRIPLFDSGDATSAERVDDELAAGFGE